MDIAWTDLLIGHIMLVVPVAILLFYRTGLVKSTLIAAMRMALQLVLVGFYLEYVFEWNNAWINSAWVLIMIIVTAYTVTGRAGLKMKYFFLPNFVSILLSIVIIDTFFLGFIIKLDYMFEARYFIPISGMILGNAMQNNIIALNSFYGDINRNITMHRYALSLGANKHESTMNYMKKALQNAFNPTIARMAVIGLVSLPGTMTGQIIGGSSPFTAIKYQIMLMLAIFTSSILTTFLAIIVSNKFVFDNYNNLRQEIFKT